MAKDRYEIDFSNDPIFNTVTGLTNITFDHSNVRSGYMATEDQILNLYNQVLDNEEKLRRCCSKLHIWEARVQIVRMNTNTIDTNNRLTSGGIVVSSFDDNVKVGFLREGFDYTVTFPLKWDNTIYVPRNVSASGSNCMSAYAPDGDTKRWTMTNYRVIEDYLIRIANCQSTSTNLARFWDGLGENYQFSNAEGARINPGGNWGQFVYDIKDDGTVTITDHRRNINYNIIRYYTQWILRKCADNSLIPDPE